MTLTIQLTPEVERLVAARAAERGQDVQAVVSELIERGIRSEPTIEEILAPFREQVAESGMTESELDDLFEEARNEVHQERTGKGP
jgi:hypothetical protein